MLVFLRHPGCAFCREALADIAALRTRLEAAGVRIVLVHHGTPGAMLSLLVRYGLSMVDRIHDPDRTLYRAFRLNRGRLSQLFGPAVWARASTALRKHGLSLGSGDPFQMPGLFLLDQCRLVRSFRHRKISDRPDYLAFCSGLSQT